MLTLFGVLLAGVGIVSTLMMLRRGGDAAFATRRFGLGMVVIAVGVCITVASLSVVS